MPAHCTCCRHTRAAEIDTALMSGVPVKTLSRRFGLSPQSLLRHQQNHVGKVLKAALDRDVEQKGDRLKRLFESVVYDLERLQRAGERKGNLSAALSAIAHKIRIIELGLSSRSPIAAAEREKPFSVRVSFSTDGRVHVAKGPPTAPATPEAATVEAEVVNAPDPEPDPAPAPPPPEEEPVSEPQKYPSKVSVRASTPARCTCAERRAKGDVNVGSFYCSVCNDRQFEAEQEGRGKFPM